MKLTREQRREIFKDANKATKNFISGTNFKYKEWISSFLESRYFLEYYRQKGITSTHIEDVRFLIV